MAVVERRTQPVHRLETSYGSIIEKIITIIGYETERKKILAAILPQALAISGAEVGALLVAGDHPDNLNAIARRGLPDEVIVQLTQGDLGRLLLMGQRLWVKPRPLQLDPQQALLGRHKLKYLFGVPLWFERRVLGAIVVGSRITSDAALGDRQQHQLDVLAQLLALFLDHIRLRTTTLQPAQNNLSTDALLSASRQAQNSDELENLLAAVMSAEEEVASQNNDLGLLNALSSEMVGTLQLNRLLEAAIKQMLNALKARAGWCYLYEEDCLVLYHQEGLSTEYVEGMKRLSLGTGVEGMAFSRNEVMMRDSLLFHTGQARQLVQNEGLQIVAATPLRAENKSFGVLAAANAEGQNWSLRDKRMLISIGHQLERAILNARKFSEVERKAQVLETSYKDLLQSNTRLTERAEVLEHQLQTLRQIERLVWNALSASAGSANAAADSETDEALAAALKNVLVILGKKTDPKFSSSSY
jgi:putative methionine-R-sulfoxide reductase with GAF domain